MSSRDEAPAAGRAPTAPDTRSGRVVIEAGRAVPRANRRPRRRRRGRFIPPQHGAWAMLIVPYLAGVLVAGVTWVDLPLAGAWLAGYLLSYYVFQAIKSRRPRRYRTQLILYMALTVPLTAGVVVARPAVLWYAPAYAVLLSVSAWYAWRRRERALGNDLAAVLQSCLMIFVAATVAGTRPAALTGIFLACAAYFAGTAFHVKSMIRERGNPIYRRRSVGFHAVVFGLSYWLSPVLFVFFGWLLVRSWMLSGRQLTPLRVGLVEISNCLLLLAAVVFVWG